jgi:hypothetical protein
MEDQQAGSEIWTNALDTITDAARGRSADRRARVDARCRAVYRGSNPLVA